MNKWQSLFTIFCLTISFQGYSATKSLKKLKDKISGLNNKINLLVAEIKDIDAKINQQNGKYVSQMKGLEELDQKLLVLNTEFEVTSAKLLEERVKAKKAFHLYLIEKNNKYKERNLLEQKLYSEVLTKKMLELKQLDENSKIQRNKVQFLRKKVSKTKQEEESLYKLIVELENKKKVASQSYIDLMEEKNLQEGELDTLIAKQKVLRKKKRVKTAKGRPLFKLNLPIDDYTELKRSKNGVTLSYKETSSLKAPYSGKVVYTGRLASYGKVIILDHGQDVRSVVLGDIVVKTKKGAVLKAGDVMGYTMADLGTIKNLYFEVRKKDTAQNTALWINKSDKTRKI